MHIISQAYLLTGVAIGISFINHKTFKMQPTIAVMLASLLCSIFLILYQGILPNANGFLISLAKIDFSQILMQGMLGFLLFAGTLTIDIKKLVTYSREIAVLAIASTICSMLIVGGAIYLLNNWLHIVPDIGLSALLLFGALISPTDPIAVLNTLKQAKAPKAIETILAGESLFNDGIGIVSFLTIYAVLFSGTEASVRSVLSLFFSQSIGGLAIGVAFGWLAIAAIKQCLKTETMPQLITIAIPTTGYSLCHWLGVSGPLAMVASGIYLAWKYPAPIQSKLHEFWLIMDELLNIILFLLVGFEVLLVQWNLALTSIAIAAIIITLLARAITVTMPLIVFNNTKAAAILIWGGLRGGLALALVLSLPDSYQHKQTILAMTYAVVLWSILVQGNTIKQVLKLNHNQ